MVKSIIVHSCCVVLVSKSKIDVEQIQHDAARSVVAINWCLMEIKAAFICRICGSLSL